ITLFDGLLVPKLVDKDLFFEGQDLSTALIKDEYKHIMINLRKTLTDGPQEWSFEANGKSLFMTTTPLFDENGEATGVVAKIDDITELTRIQKELKAALEQAETAVHELASAQITTSAMFDANSHINVMFNDKFRVVDCNPAALEFFGFEKKEEMLSGFVARMMESIPAFQPDGHASIPLAHRLMTAATEGYVAFETEIYIGGVKKNLDVEFKRIAYKDSFAIVGYVFDLTDIHKREMELAHAHELNKLQLTKLNLVVQASKIGLWDMKTIKDDPVNLGGSNDPAGPNEPTDQLAEPSYAFTWSKEFRQMLGFEDEIEFPNELNSWSDRLHPDDAEETLEAFDRFMYDKTGKTPYDVEYRIQKKNNDYIYVHDTCEAIRDEEGHVVHTAGALIDITDTKNILLDTERQKIEAEAANKAKSTFLSTMSHEIRTPMNAILGITEIQLQNLDLDQKTREAFERVYTSGDLLLGIINDILDLSKIEAGKLELDVNKYEPASLISDTAQLNMMRIGSKPIDFSINVDEATPAILIGDELRIKQVLNNVLSNAIKYTAQGNVKLSVSAEATDGSDDITLVFAISDTGQGMTQEQIAKLFDEYARFNMETNRSTEGTGLGMSITRNLVRLMDGEIHIESEPGKGSTFTVLIPQVKIGDACVGKEIADNLRQFRQSSRSQMKRVQITREPMPYGNVLIVDDVETNIYVARGLLLPYELTVDAAASGFAAIEKIQNGKVYDIVFMDHMMPKMDGVEATKIIRNMGYDLPIVALTANAVAGQADIFLANGFDDYIAKPIDIRQLNNVLNKLIRDKQPLEVIEAARAQAEAKNKADARNGKSADQNAQPAISQKFADIFVRDARKALEALEAAVEKDDYSDEDTLRTYTINVHGMKSALANVGKMDLSAEALKLETASREGKLDIVITETPAFIRSLRAFTDELVPQKNEAADEEIAEDKVYLEEMLRVIHDASNEFDEQAIEKALVGLEEKTWASKTKELLDRISEQLLHSDFDEIAAEIDLFWQK
ncbi:MAG: ATP-binding protein, partial [Coriobacteriia bacterium]|nr:ATP-binding protein [Coriobacteriia bacterium]